MATLRQGGQPDRRIPAGLWRIWTATPTGLSSWVAFVRAGDILFIASTEWIVDILVYQQ